MSLGTDLTAPSSPQLPKASLGTFVEFEGDRFRRASAKDVDQNSEFNKVH